MRRLVYADESNTDGTSKCFGIGAFSFAAADERGFLRAFNAFKAHHRISSELHWAKIRNSTAPINFLLDWFYLLMNSREGRFDAIVVDATKYRHWNTRSMSREVAFYKIYSMLLKYIASETFGSVAVFIDDRSDSYSRQDEALEVIANHMLLKAAASGRLSKVSKIDSRLSPAIQIADLLTGAIVAAHAQRLDPTHQINHGKRLAIARLAQMLGWDDLCYDTHPGSKMNVWHFPLEYRAFPRTLRIRAVRRPQYVTRDELAQGRLANSTLKTDGASPRSLV